MIEKGSKICFITPPAIGKSVIRDYAGGLGFEADSGYILPPLNLMQLAACTGTVFNVLLIDAQAENLTMERLLKKVIDAEVTLIVMEMSIPTLESDIYCARLFKQAGLKVVVKIATKDESLLYKILADNVVVFCLTGECDDNICDILLGNDLRGVARIENNKLHIYSKPFIVDLNILPYPKRSLVNHNVYVYPKLGKCTTALTSRGCPFSCKYYCPYPLTQGNKWRFRTSENVLDEIGEIKKLGINHILFRDPVFTLSEKRVEKICQGIIERDMGIEWWCETRADYLSDGLMVLMGRAGCQGINIGVESGDSNLRFSLLKRGVSNNDIIRVAGLGKKIGIKICFLLMVGFPGETKNSILNTAKILLKCRPFSIGVSFPVNYTGTKFDADARNNGWLMDIDSVNLNGSVPVILNNEIGLHGMIDGRDLLLQLFKAMSMPDKKNEHLAFHMISAWAKK